MKRVNYFSTIGFDGATNARGITPRSGPVDGKGGVVWIELTSAVNNPDPSNLAEDFLEFVQKPEISKAVAFTEGTYNPVSQMGSDKVMSLFDKEYINSLILIFEIGCFQSLLIS